MVFGLIFKTDLETYLPFLATSVIVWNYISSTISDGCTTFISADQMLRQMRIPHIQLVLRVVWRNLLISAHNFVVLPIVFLVFGTKLDWALVLAIPGFALVIANLLGAVWVLGIVSARYRDMIQIVSSLLNVAFYVTPVMWFPKLLEDSELAHLLLGLNPLYHLLQIIRLPVLGQTPTLENWLVSSLSALTILFSASLVHRRFAKMISYWV